MQRGWCWTGLLHEFWINMDVWNTSHRGGWNMYMGGDNYDDRDDDDDDADADDDDDDDEDDNDEGLEGWGSSEH